VVHRALRPRQRRAVAIVVVLSAVVVSAVIVGAILVRTTSLAGRVRDSLNVRGAIWVADGGLHHGLMGFPPSLFTSASSGVIYGALPTGGYQVLCTTEQARGALGQTVAHVVAVGVTDGGGRAGTVMSLEAYPSIDGLSPPEVVPLAYHRFGRAIDLADKPTVRELLLGDWAIERRQQLIERTTNDEHELAVDGTTYRTILTNAGSALPAGALRDDWPAVVSALVARKISLPSP